DPDHLLGVVLRLNDDGSAPTDNPFAGVGRDVAKVYAYGIRNSYGYDLEPTTGDLWLQVNGQAEYDEIGRYPAGSNVGWIQLMGPPERIRDYKAIEEGTERKFDNPSFPPSRLADAPEEAQNRLFMLPGAR